MSDTNSGAATATRSETAGASKTFVLVHGAWHGGWCWRRIADRLEAKGHRVFTPTLTGLADRSHLLGPQVGLDTHIADIVNLFKWEHIGDACLVPHSYGGWPCSGALEEIGDRVSAIVWLDAFLPNDGERGFDASAEFSRKALLEAVARGEIARRAPPAEAFGVLTEADRAWVDELVTPQPNAIPMQPIKLNGARENVAKKTYIRAPKYPMPAFDRAFAACESDPAWTTLQVDGAGHDVMIDAPDWLTDILIKHS